MIECDERFTDLAVPAGGNIDAESGAATPWEQAVRKSAKPIRILRITYTLGHRSTATSALTIYP